MAEQNSKGNAVENNDKPLTQKQIREMAEQNSSKGGKTKKNKRKNRY
jgi:hypothetical protein